MDEAANLETGTASSVTLSVTDRIARIRLDNPARRNALSLQAVKELHEAVSAVSTNGKVRTVIIEAVGPAFCPGHDLKEIHAHRSDDDSGRAYFEELFNSCSQMMLAITNSPKIFIARVHAVATAGGCQLVAACDLAVASSSARFGVNGINAGLFCSTPMVALSRNTGRKKALEMLTTGHMMSAEQACANGLVNQVAEPDDLDHAVNEMAQAVAAKSPKVLALGKSAFYRQLEMPLAEAYAFTSQKIVENLLMDDAIEGIGAFVEKRKPVWKD